MRTVIVLAKEPVPGRVTTRLQTEFTPREAAALARAALIDTLAAVRRTPGRPVLALDGGAGPWLPADVAVVRQRGESLDERIAAAFEDAYSGSPIVLVGMDTPQVTPELLGMDWDDHDAVLGLTEDGGYWCLGLPRPDWRAVVGVPMSTARTGAEQLRRLESLGYRVKLLPTLRDMDTPEDAAVIAARYPGLRVAALHRRLQHSAHPEMLFERALDGVVEVVAMGNDGRTVVALSEVDRWRAPADAVDLLALSRCEGPVLDIGCGPGRIVMALAERGIAALGVDISAQAVRLTTRRGAAALRRPVEAPLPGEGRWGTVLLMDGNIGIGGDPAALLRRCADLVRPDGLVLVEVDEQDDLDDTAPIVLHSITGRRSTPLPWARIGARAAVRHARGAGLHPTEEWRAAGRTFLAFRMVTR